MLLPSAELRLNSAVVWSDVAAFRDSIARVDFETAAALHSGVFLEGFYLKTSGEFDSWVEAERASLAQLATRVIETLAEQAAGQRDEARRIVRMLLDPSRHRYVPPFHIAIAYAGIGDADEAFRWLERSYQEHGSFMGAAKAETAFESLHGDPRWPAPLRCIQVASSAL